MTREEAIKKEFLEDKKIILKPSPRQGGMVPKDKGHIMYFKMDGTSTFFSLPRKERGDLVNVFKSDEERKYFENTLGLDLNEARPGNFFETFYVKVTKDDVLMQRGEIFDLSDPMDNLRYRILKVQSTIAPSWEQRLDSNKYIWALVDETKLEKEAEEEFDSQQEIWMYLGKISDDTPKLRTALTVYLNTIGSKVKIPLDAKKREIMKELNKIAADKKSRERFLDVCEGDLFDSKVMVLRALETGGIVKEGNDTFLFAGEEQTHKFVEIAERLHRLEEEQDDLYFKLVEQIENSK